MKILLKILLRGTRNKTKPEVSKLQCGCVKDSGTRNALFISFHFIFILHIKGGSPVGNEADFEGVLHVTTSSESKNNGKGRN